MIFCFSSPSSSSTRVSSHHHTQDGKPPQTSVLRITQCVFALSSINIVLSSFKATSAEHPLQLFADCLALIVAMLCALHAMAGILRRGYTSSSSSSSFSISSTSPPLPPAALAAVKKLKKAGNNTEQQQQSSYSRKDSVYGGDNRSRVYKDFLLLSFIILSALALILVRQQEYARDHHHHVTSICMMVGLALLFSYKPLRMVNEMKEEFVGQFVLVKMLINGLIVYGKGGKGSSGIHEHDDIFDENDLSMATRPEVLAAEVIRLRRRVVELEEKLEGEEGDGGGAVEIDGDRRLSASTAEG